jgi:hypothetical protein
VTPRGGTPLRDRGPAGQRGLPGRLRQLIIYCCRRSMRMGRPLASRGRRQPRARRGACVADRIA